MVIEILYPEIANLFGELANIKYIQASIPQCEIINTDLNSKPAFLQEGSKIDLVYMGNMSENSQVIAMDYLEPYKDEIKTAIESGQHFLFTGNAFELLANDILDLDDLPYDSSLLNKEGSSRINQHTKTTTCLGIFDISVKREIMHRFNSLYLGRYKDLEIVGFKSVFSYASLNRDIPPLFETIKGPGLDKSSTGEGIRYKNFMATYLTGPLMVLNPKYMIEFLSELGEKDINPPVMDAAMDAYNQRLSEFKSDKIPYEY